MTFISLWQDRGQTGSAWVTHSCSLAFSRHFVTLQFSAVLKHLRWHLYNKKAVGFPGPWNRDFNVHYDKNSAVYFILIYLKASMAALTSNFNG